MLRTIWSNSEDRIKKDVLKETNPTVELARADQRGHRRSLIAVPMRARWTDDREHEVKVNSRDISDGGIFFHSSCAIAIGTEVEVTFTVPSDPGDAGNKHLRVRGTIVRAERGGDKTGYALEVTRSEFVEADDTVAQARQAMRHLSANNASRPSRSRRAHILFLAGGGVLGLIVLGGLGVLAIREGVPAKAVAAIREMVGGMHATAQNATAADVPESRSERKRKVLRSAGAVEPAEKKAAPTVAEQEVGERNDDASTAQGRSLTGDATVQPPPVSFNNNHVVTLDTQKGKPVSELGYIGELPSPMAQPAPGDSLASPSAKIEPATAMQTSTAVVLRVVVGRDGHVEDVQRASGPAELSPASVAAIRQWKFQPNPNGPKHRQIYVTVNFTISPQ